MGSLRAVWGADFDFALVVESAFAPVSALSLSSPSSIGVLLLGLVAVFLAVSLDEVFPFAFAVPADDSPALLPVSAFFSGSSVSRLASGFGFTAGEVLRSPDVLFFAVVSVFALRG